MNSSSVNTSFPSTLSAFRWTQPHFRLLMNSAYQRSPQEAASPAAPFLVSSRSATAAARFWNAASPVAARSGATAPSPAFSSSTWANSAWSLSFSFSIRAGMSCAATTPHRPNSATTVVRICFIFSSTPLRVPGTASSGFTNPGLSSPFVSLVALW